MDEDIQDITNEEEQNGVDDTTTTGNEEVIDNPGPEEEGENAASSEANPYLGIEELKYAISLINMLGDKKYLPIDGIPGVARNAETANRLAKSVSINGQLFDGTQNITFDEYAKTSDILKKTDLARVGAEDNSNKIVSLNLNNKIDEEFINFDSVQNKIDSAVNSVEEKLNTHTATAQTMLDDIRATENNDIADVKDDIIKIAPAQARIDVHEETLPASAYLPGSYDIYQVFPIEVLKITEEENKKIVLDYQEFGYGETDPLATVEPHHITINQKIEIPLLVNSEYEHISQMTAENYEEHPDGWQQPGVVETNGISTYYWEAFVPAEAFNTGFALKTYCPEDDDFCYGAIIDNIAYCISDNKLTVCENTSEDIGDMIYAIVRGSKNVALTKEMLMDQDIPKDKGVSIILCKKTNETIKPFDISLEVISQAGYIVETKDEIDLTNVQEIEKISPKYNLDDGCDIKFAIKSGGTKSLNDGLYTFSSEKKLSPTTIDDTAENGLSISEMENIPSEVWKDVGSFSFLFVFKPKEPDSICELNDMEITYTKSASVTKAIYGTDYVYRYTQAFLIMTFFSNGKYWINYMITDFPEKQLEGPMDIEISHSKMLP